MTFTLQAVNELIQSLESAGELSIKETKVMALAKAYLDVAAENAELKEDRDTLARYWIEDGGDEDCAMSYCEPTPATDRIVARIKADGVEEFVEKCRDKSKQAISSDIRDNWWLAGEHADDFAQQLREGAK
ncbi:hypothetical protein [Klebsiella oxytoca]|uniref:hypothetical protein n=1 Tax=Klebsiella oxytoca TaxID=571 RepID=UPI001DB8CEE5|nr:hypothetical protein [Klebsiella oxytoca]CAF2854597.1 hypothetical protein AI2945V1_1613 [Klebsiella oxytoca]CAF2865688.1 hypothetical protein AI2946V1_1612 [Klebsiella oxytoca]CAH5525450.1 hypothetical protein AI2946V1_1612 [Klebsiella oxytoca]CAH5600513.1 hypothetical protein AI2945V1_1613 [Klebsiella oxytoca]